MFVLHQVWIWHVHRFDVQHLQQELILTFLSGTKLFCFLLFVSVTDYYCAKKFQYWVCYVNNTPDDADLHAKRANLTHLLISVKHSTKWSTTAVSSYSLHSSRQAFSVESVCLTSRRWADAIPRKGASRSECIFQYSMLVGRAGDATAAGQPYPGGFRKRKDCEEWQLLSIREYWGEHLMGLLIFLASLQYVLESCGLYVHSKVFSIKVL